MVKRVSIGEYCKKIPTLSTDYIGLIDYIDISSVDNAEKKIVSFQTFDSKEAPSRAKQLLQKGDILVSTVRPNLNAVAVIDKITENLMVGSTGYCVLRCTADLDKRYLFNFCQSEYFIDDMTSQATGASYPAVTSGIVKKSLIPYYSLEEQRTIAATLDKVTALIDKHKRQLELLDELVKSRFVELFGDPLSNDKGWSEFLITEVCQAIFGGGTPAKSHPEYFTGDIPWVSPKDMKSSVINDSIDHITEEAIAHSTTNLVPTNSVLMVIRSGILKHTLPVATNSVPVTINQDMKAFVPNATVTTAFLMHYFKAIESDVLSGVRGVTADNIDFKAFQKRSIITPPIKLQEQFATFVEQTDKSKQSVQQSLEKLETLKKSLMQEYFG